ncbi:dihydropteroate synthase [Mobilicoccus pelagius NBRC 104925]|uniref:Dihydropteroate synthase n=2 Tax=Mobilicoccus TaxID=984996 RepID=H5US77_9MICO|nr:dihydropteroate synthase [Mobilicoccus pelagius NBRC 104925]
MGIVNVTPDSFSDGGHWADTETAVAHGLDLARQGAEILDVGGESTRPGSRRPSEREELDRVLPVVSALARAGLRISVDTMRAGVAAATLDAGAEIVNDVSGGLADPEMIPLVARTGATYVAMHWRGHGEVMQQHAVYDDVVADVRRELLERVDAILAAGVAPERLVLDPGLGFAKTPAHNWQLMAHLREITDLPYRVLVGASRKTFLGRLGGVEEPVPPARRDAATAATSLLSAQAGAWAVRVHDVPSTLAALQVYEEVAAAATSADGAAPDTARGAGASA